MRKVLVLMIFPALLLVFCGQKTQSPAPSPAADIPLRFEHVVVDETPFQDDWFGMDDCNAVDFDSDGYLDIWFSGNTDLKPGSEEAYQIEWYHNPGSTGGTWERFKIHPGNYLGASVGDVDGDGDWDIISGRDYGTGRFVWLENTGDFAHDWPEHSISEQMPFHPDEVHTADLNRDGRLDLVVATFREHLYYLPGPEDPVNGPWELLLIAESEQHHGGAALADLDGDGDRDAVWGNAWYENPGDPAQVPWAAHWIDSIWTTSTKAAVGDLDRDGRPDVVLSGEESEDGIAWFHAPANPAAGQWTRNMIAADYDHVHSLQVADFDLDGDLDLLGGQMHHNEGRHRVTVFQNINIGRNEWKECILAETGTHNAKIGDLNGDGLPDVVGKNWGGDHKAEIWPNTTPVESKLKRDDWTIIRLDSTRVKWGDFAEPGWLKYFGLAMEDCTGDGYRDFVAGRYFYRNPGGDMTGPWTRVDFGFNVDGYLIVDVDGDEYADAIAEALPDVYWLEADDRQGSSWTAHKIGAIPATDHVNGQGYELAQLVAGGRPEIVLAGGAQANEIYYFEIPDDPLAAPWPVTRVADRAVDEGIGIGDMDGDGDIDVCAGSAAEDGKYVAWWANPGDGSPDWSMTVVGECFNWPDRVEMADVSGDGRQDIVLSEEAALDGCHVFWYEQPAAGPNQGGWTRRLLTEQFTTNAMDAADMDGDGDVDIITGEHRGTEKLAVWENLDGGRTWAEHVISFSRESHLGARVADLDNDGDLDIVSIAWDAYQSMYLWRNDSN